MRPEHAAGAQPRLCVIGLDGATFDLITPWAQAGKLPTLQRLLGGGTHASLESVIPPVTPPAWTSLMTGMNPGKHGLVNFIEYDPQHDITRYTNGSNRRVPTIWQLLNEHGLRVGIINVPMTYPPEALHGYCIAGLDTPDKHAPFVYPPALKTELEQAVGEIYLDPRYLGFLKTAARRQQLLDTLMHIATRRTAMAEYLLRQHPTDVIMLVYTAIDTVQHYFWEAMTQGAEARGDDFQHAIYQIYHHLDTHIAHLLRLLPPACPVLVLSDHGAGPVSATVFHLNQYLVELGLLAYKNTARPQQWLQRLSAPFDHRLRGWLSPRQKSWLAATFPALQRHWETYANAHALIDWPHTQAYSLEWLSFPGDIWINVQGRTPHGTVAPGAAYEALLARLTEHLYALRDPATDQPLIRKVYRKDELYHGPYLDHLPDLTIAWWEEPAFQARRSAPGARHASVRLAEPAADERTALWSGTHRLHGILIMSGGPFRQGHQLQQAHITDIAPTLLHLLRVPIPIEMDGKVLEEAFDEYFRAAQPLQYRQTPWFAPVACDTPGAYTMEEAAKVRERLRALGYLE